MKKTNKILVLLFFFAILIMPLTAKAFVAKADDSVYVAKDEIIDGNLYAAGANLTVDGTVKGDVICAGQSININGTVQGDVICAGQSININGVVEGNVRSAGNSISINGAVARNVMAFGASVGLGSDASVGWDMLVGGANVEIRGKIGGDLNGGAANTTIAGEIGGNIELTIDDHAKKENREIAPRDKENSNLNITKDAIIGGTLIYTATQEADIAEGSLITGGITHNSPKIAKKIKKDFGLAWGFSKLYSIFASLIIGLVLISLWRDEIKKITDKMLQKVGPTIGWGVVIMFLTPIITILLLITLIGIPLAGILILTWLITLWLSKIFVGVLVGRLLLEKLKYKKDSIMLAMVLGIITIQILFSIPRIGWLACLAATWWGLGGLFLYFRKA